MYQAVGKAMRLCRPQTCVLSQCNKAISKHLFERATAEENIHFLKLQREQLKSLRKKILSQKKKVTSKISHVDNKIKTLEKPDDNTAK